MDWYTSILYADIDPLRYMPRSDIAELLPKMIKIGVVLLSN
jgi:hypothetical protein